MDARNDQIRLLMALDNGWALADDSDDDPSMVLVNESREEMEDFHPNKSLVNKMLKEGLITYATGFAPPSQREPFTYRTQKGPDAAWKEVSMPEPIVYLHTITVAGRQLLDSATDK